MLALIRIIKIRLPVVVRLNVFFSSIVFFTGLVASSFCFLLLFQVGRADREEWSSPKDAIFCTLFCCTVFVCGWFAYFFFSEREDFYKSLFVDCQKTSASVSNSHLKILCLFFTRFRDFPSCTKLSSSSSH